MRKKINPTVSEIYCPEVRNFYLHIFRKLKYGLQFKTLSKSWVELLQFCI